MKKLILTAFFALFAIASSFANSMDFVASNGYIVNDEIVEEVLSFSKFNSEEVDVLIEVNLDDETLTCQVTITVSIGIVSVSGTVSGPCDEVKAQAVELLGELINEAKDIATNL